MLPFWLKPLSNSTIIFACSLFSLLALLHRARVFRGFCCISLAPRFVQRRAYLQTFAVFYLSLCIFKTGPSGTLLHRTLCRPSRSYRWHFIN